MKSGKVAVPAKVGTGTVRPRRRWLTISRRGARRAAKVSVGAIAGAVACAVVAVGGADGAAILAKTTSLPMTMVAVAVTALVAISVIRRVQFVSPSARAQ